MTHVIQLPEKNRTRVLAARERTQKYISGQEQADSAFQTEIKSLEFTKSDLTKRAATLGFQAVSSDTFAGELVQVERRIAAVGIRLDQLRTSPLPQIDITETFGVVFETVYFFQEQVKILLLRDLEPWRVDGNAIRLLFAQLPALAALRNISAWLSTSPDPTINNLNRILFIFDLALSGQVDFSRNPDSQNVHCLP